MVTAVLLLVVLVLPWPTPFLFATVPGGDTAEPAGLVVPADNEAQYPSRPALGHPGRPCQRLILDSTAKRSVGYSMLCVHFVHTQHTAPLYPFCRAFILATEKNRRVR